MSHIVKYLYFLDDSGLPMFNFYSHHLNCGLRIEIDSGWKILHTKTFLKKQIESNSNKSDE